MTDDKLLKNWLQYVHKVAGGVCLPDRGCDEDNCKAQIAIGEIFNATALAATGHEVNGPGPKYDDVGTECLTVYVNEIAKGWYCAYLLWEVSTLEAMGATGIIAGTAQTDEGVATGEVLVKWKDKRDALFPDIVFTHSGITTISTPRSP